MTFDIFISYRRETDGISNFHIAKSYKLQFEKEGFNNSVFLDRDECTDGYFEKTILPAIHTCKYFILLLTKNAMDRCSEDGDWVRKEILEAQKCQKKIIPITPCGVCEKWPSTLPESLHFLSKEHISTIHDGRSFDSDIKELIKDRKMKPTKGVVDSVETITNVKLPCLKVQCNMDCWLYIDDESKGNLFANKIKKIPLAKGEYLIRVQNSLTDDGAYYIEKKIVMPDMEYFLEPFDLLKVKNDWIAKKKSDQKKNNVQQKRIIFWNKLMFKIWIGIQNIKNEIQFHTLRFLLITFFSGTGIFISWIGHSIFGIICIPILYILYISDIVQDDL